MSIANLVEQIRLLPDAFVDCGIRQDRSIVVSQMNQRMGREDEGFAVRFIEDAQRRISALEQRAKPYSIPEDYIFFLEYYGGITIENDFYYFSTFGIGVMVEEFYVSIDSDDVLQEPGKDGFLSLGILSFREGKHKFQYINFFLDLASIVQQNSVIGIGPWGKGDIPSKKVIKDIDSHPTMWRKTASSFAHWLEQVLETQGLFGYL